MPRRGDAALLSSQGQLDRGGALQGGEAVLSLPAHLRRGLLQQHVLHGTQIQPSELVLGLRQRSTAPPPSCACEVPDVLLGGARMSMGHSRPSQVPTNPRKAASSPRCSVSADKASFARLCSPTAAGRCREPCGARGAAVPTSPQPGGAPASAAPALTPAGSGSPKRVQ